MKKIFKFLFKIAFQLLIIGILPLINIIAGWILIKYWWIVFSEKIWEIKPFPYVELGLLVGMSGIVIGLWLVEILYNSQNN